MERTMFLSLLIVCGCFSQVIGTRENIDTHVRKKRIIYLEHGEKKPSTIQEVPYIVRILENGKLACGGTILSPEIILTAAHCVAADSKFHVFSGSESINVGITHNITRKIIYDGYRRAIHVDDLALLFINPLINYLSSHNRDIKIFRGYLPPNSVGTISGWGCNFIEGETRRYPTQLHSVTLPIISQRECERFYRHVPHIIEREICVHDFRGKKGCSFGDSGAPLVVKGKLLGVLAFLDISTNPYFPSVFTDLRFKPYRDWILRYVPHAI